jgi:hypothetical protein
VSAILTGRPSNSPGMERILDEPDRTDRTLLGRLLLVLGAFRGARTGITTAPEPRPVRLKMGAGACVNQLAVPGGVAGVRGEVGDDGEDGGEERDSDACAERESRAHAGMAGIGGAITWLDFGRRRVVCPADNLASLDAGRDSEVLST